LSNLFYAFDIYVFSPPFSTPNAIQFVQKQATLYFHLLSEKESSVH
jgi:hypothetical protein